MFAGSRTRGQLNKLLANICRARICASGGRPQLKPEVGRELGPESERNKTLLLAGRDKSRSHFIRSSGRHKSRPDEQLNYGRRLRNSSPLTHPAGPFDQFGAGQWPGPSLGLENEFVIIHFASQFGEFFPSTNIWFPRRGPN